MALFFIDGETPFRAHVVSDEGPALLKAFLKRHDFPPRLQQLVWPFFISHFHGQAAWRARKLAHGMRWITKAQLYTRTAGVLFGRARKRRKEGLDRDPLAAARERAAVDAQRERLKGALRKHEEELRRAEGKGTS